MIVRLARTLAVAGAVVVLAFYAEVLAHAPVAGQDFRNFYAAATVLSHGGNPYDMRQLLRQEVQLYHPTTPGQYASLAGNPYPEGPPLAITLIPLVGHAPSSVYPLYAATLGAMALLALGVLGILYPTERPARRAAVLLISPVVFLGVLLGQPDAALLLTFVVALWCLQHERSSVAGFILALGLVKPQIIAGPIMLLAILAWRHGHLRSYLAGLAAGVAAFIGGSLLIAGPDVVAGWMRELAGFGGHTVYTQVDISSLTTLYIGWAPHAVTVALALVMPLAWLVCSAVAWRTSRPEQGERWWLVTALTGWLLATPYAHPHDGVLLLPAVWYLLDNIPTRGPGRSLGALLWLAWWLIPLTSVLGLRPPLLRGLGVIPVLLLLALLVAQRDRTQSEAAPVVAVLRAG